MRSIGTVVPNVNTYRIGARISGAHKIDDMKRKPLSADDAAAPPPEQPASAGFFVLDEKNITFRIDIWNDIANT